MLVVVVVIAILTTITVVAYTSIQKRSQRSAAMAEFQSNSQRLAAYALANNAIMPTYAQTQADSSIAIAIKGDVYKRATYCNGVDRAAFGAELKSGEKVYMEVGDTPKVDNAIDPTSVCSTLGITNANGSAATVSFIIGGTTWVVCANEGGTCTFSGVTSVRYGANGTFNTINNVNGSIGCNNTVFGDPTPGVAKSCYYLN